MNINPFQSVFRVIQSSPFITGVEAWAGQGSYDERRAEAAERIILAYHEGSTSLDLKGLGLESLPKEVFQLRDLTHLDLEDNSLSSISSSIYQLGGLIELNLSWNQLESIPASIGQLGALEKLDLSNNQLLFLPESICRLEYLTRLSLSSNKLSSLPEDFGRLRSLIWLYLAWNRLESLPESIGNLEALKTLDLRSNLIEYLPASVCQLGALETLLLRDNLLSALTLDFGQLEALKTLDLGRNELESLPARIGQLSGNDDGYFAIVVQAQEDGHDLEYYLTEWAGHNGEERYKELPQITLAINYDQKVALQDFLKRLKETSSFETDRINLSKIICNILLTVKNDVPFRDLFFQIVQENLERCGDRAAMTLNYIYTAWISNNLPEGGYTEKFNTLIGCLRTDKVRGIVNNLIEADWLRRVESGAVNVERREFAEDVELQLYAESQLEVRLGLVTASHSMRHEEYVDKDLLDLDVIISQVEDMSELEISSGLEAMGNLWSKFLNDYFSFESEIISCYFSELLDPALANGDEVIPAEEALKKSAIISKLEIILRGMTSEDEQDLKVKGRSEGEEINRQNLIMKTMKVCRYLYIRSEIEKDAADRHR